MTIRKLVVPLPVVVGACPRVDQVIALREGEGFKRPADAELSQEHGHVTLALTFEREKHVLVHRLHWRRP